MKTWRMRASVTGACLFALLTGAGAVFAGNWWGQHHGAAAVRYVQDPTTVTATRTVQASELVPQPYAVDNPAPATTVSVPGPTATRTMYVPGPTVTRTVPGPTVTRTVTVPAPNPSGSFPSGSFPPSSGNSGGG